MGFLDPKTKADCDREIARLEGVIASNKASIARMKGNPGFGPGAIASAKASLENHKGELAKMKALRRTLK
jgi:hypothetical protein